MIETQIFVGVSSNTYVFVIVKNNIKFDKSLYVYMYYAML
jgi:hypothetical protein